MAKRKSPKKPAQKKGGGKKQPDIKTQLFKVVLGLLALVFLVVTAGVVTHYILKRHQPRPPVKKPMVVRPTKPDKVPTYEIYSKETVAPSRPIPEPKPIPVVPLPRVTIIVDDIGYDKRIAEKFLKLDSALTISILPKSPYDKKLSQLARENGSEVMLHLPMEPKEYPRIDPGPGALLTHMSPDELIRQLEDDLDAVPGIKGVNNHMGSRLTGSSPQMNQVFSVLKKRGLYFVDSKTAPESYGESSARLFQVPYAERDVFIDHYQTSEFIRKQIELLVRIAEKHGTAIGIAHPHEVTYQVLSDMLPEIKKRVKIVPASQLVSKAG